MYPPEIPVVRLWRHSDGSPAETQADYPVLQRNKAWHGAAMPNPFPMMRILALTLLLTGPVAAADQASLDRLQRERAPHREDERHAEREGDRPDPSPEPGRIDLETGEEQQECQPHE